MEFNSESAIVIGVYTISIFLVQTLIEFIKAKYSLKSQLYAERRIDAIDKLFQAINKLERFVYDIIWNQPENFNREWQHKFADLFNQTNDTINTSQIFINDSIYKKAMQFINNILAMTIPAKRMAEISKHYFYGSGPLPEGIENDWELTQLTKSKRKELEELLNEMSSLKDKLRKEIKRKIYY